jgi:hypothetical protein
VTAPFRGRQRVISAPVYSALADRTGFHRLRSLEVSSLTDRTSLHDFDLSLG